MAEPYKEHLRVLVVDDNPAIHQDFRRIFASISTARDPLERMEHELFGGPPSNRENFARVTIDSAHQGEEAIELVRRALDEGNPYAVAFVDVRMPPGLDGIATIAKFWQLDPNVQAVVCTAYSDHSWSEIIETLGQGDRLLVLKKPFDPIEALQMTFTLGRKWHLARDVRSRLAELDSLVVARTEELERANGQLRREISQRRQAEQELRELATHDQLTGLPNRALLGSRLSSALAKARRSGTHTAVLVLDLDRFKDVNDAHGHPVGDALLKETAKRLTECARESDTVTRLGGDEFVLVLEDLGDPEDAAIVAERILKACSEPIHVEGHALRAPPSIGIALFPTDFSEPESLLKGADTAMYQAKAAGGGTFRYFSRELYARTCQRAELREALDQALSNGQFSLAYQPLVELKSGKVASMEALLRWTHPRLGSVSPATFIPLAESSGQIVGIGSWVLDTALDQLVEWRARGARDLCVSVNVSPRQLRTPNFVQTVLASLARSGLPGEALELELTESTAAGSLQQASAVLRDLAAHGIRIAIDDFGCGYSSFARLRDLPVSTLKLDRSLIRNVADDPRETVIVATIVSACKTLGIAVVAEGVETAAQLDALRHLDIGQRGLVSCDVVQGYLLSKPLAPAVAWDYLSLSGTTNDAPNGSHVSATERAVAPKRTSSGESLRASPAPIRISSAMFGK